MKKLNAKVIDEFIRIIENSRLYKRIVICYDFTDDNDDVHHFKSKHYWWKKRKWALREYEAHEEFEVDETCSKEIDSEMEVMTELDVKQALKNLPDDAEVFLRDESEWEGALEYNFEDDEG